MKIALIGYGKMGRAIEKLVTSMEHEVVYVQDKDRKSGDLKQADVAIEFSVPQAAFNNIRSCMEAGIPVVSGTTGWLERYDELADFCAKCNGSLVYASNFSIGVNLFFEINRYTAELMSAWDMYEPSLEEVHHIHKKDAPSGTAISLAEPVCKAYGLEGWTLEPPVKGKLAVRAIREGEVRGIHRVRYESHIDGISLKHEAYSREGFAKGAILAASWIRGKKGIFGMSDVLGLKQNDQR